MLPGSILIDLNDNFYQNLIVPSEIEKVDQRNSSHHSIDQHQAYEFENFLINLSKIRMKTKSISNGHVHFVQRDHLVAIARNITTEINILLLFNTNNNTDIRIDVCTREIRMKNADAKIEFSNANDFDGNILFNGNNLPLVQKNLCSYCSVIFSWAFRPLDVEDML